MLVGRANIQLHCLLMRLSAHGNMDSLSTQTLIPFCDEYQHLQHYLSIEMLRFDNLKVIYDVEVEDFALPSLTVQPIVENAVKHGITKGRDGGTLTIATREKEECYQITVTDDGVGFDAQQILSQERSHIVMDNFDCDYYDFLHGLPSGANAYAGKYMSQYSWAEMTLATLE